MVVGKRLAIKIKITFFLITKKVPTAIKLEGGWGGQDLNGTAIKNFFFFFCGFPYFIVHITIPTL